MNLSWSAFITATLLADSTSAKGIKGSHAKRELQGWQWPTNKGQDNGQRNGSHGKQDFQGQGPTNKGQGNGQGNGRTAANGDTQAIYTMSNLSNNEIVIFTRNEDNGELTFANTVATGGSGGGFDPFGGTGFGNFLDSTDPVIVAKNCLLAVNAGSNEVSTFQINSISEIELVGTYPTNGDTPVSVAENDGLVFVLNARGNGSIQGYRLNPGQCSLTANGGPVALDQQIVDNPVVRPGVFSPAQIGFTPQGQLLVLIKMNNGDGGPGSLNLYDVSGDGTIGNLEQIVIPGFGASDYAFEFTPSGQLLVVDALGDGGEVTPGVGLGQVRLFDEEYNQVSVASSEQFGSCWMRYNPGNSCVYATNTPVFTISSFKLENSEVELVESAAASAIAPVDLYVSSDYRYLYTTNCVSGTSEFPFVTVYQMAGDCGLTEVQSIAAPGLGCGLGLASYSGPGRDEIISES
jgi:6-phosphogluconolactonase (cycloisomerase 2 family)